MRFLLNHIKLMFLVRTIGLIGFFLSIHGNLFASHHLLQLSGDILHIAIPATAGMATLKLKDFEGSKELLKGLVATGLTTYGLKYLIQEEGPHHRRYSFPSGHTSMAFLGSGFIQYRYGWRYAIPVHLAAAFVGYSRIKTKAHWVHDVLAGAAIGLFYSYLLTTPYQNKNCCFYSSFTSQSVALHCEGLF